MVEVGSITCSFVGDATVIPNVLWGSNHIARCCVLLNRKNSVFEIKNNPKSGGFHVPVTVGHTYVNLHRQHYDRV